MAETSFHAQIQTVKDAIDGASTNAELKAYLTSIANSINRFANILKTRRYGAIEWTSPYHWFKEFWAPRQAKVIDEWRQVENALVSLRIFIDAIPKNSDAPSVTDDAKMYTIDALSNAHTIYSFQTDTDGQLTEALGNLGTDIANAPKVLGQALKSGGEIIANHVIKPLGEGGSAGLSAIIWSIIKGLWWLFLLAAIVLAGIVLVMRYGGISGIASRIVAG